MFHDLVNESRLHVNTLGQLVDNALMVKSDETVCCLLPELTKTVRLCGLRLTAVKIDNNRLLTLQRQLFQIAAVRRVQRHTGLTHHF